jgi:pimeloyl-ACP methyl ester carboxylesterase
MRTDVQERRVPVGECELNVAEAGAGPAVLLLHGFPDRWQLWRHQLPVLVEAGYRVIAPDLRGFGESDRPDAVADYALPRLVGDIRGLLDAVGVQRATVVGHDWGAGLAWAVASALPDRVDALVPLSVGHGLGRFAAGEQQRRLSWYMLWFLFPGVAEQVLPADDWAAFREWAWTGRQPGADPEADRQIADLSRPGALTAALNWYRANIDPVRYLAHRPPGRFTPITCPTMGVWSDGDPFLGETQMSASADFVTGPWRYERVTGVGHWIPVMAPDRLNALLLDFLAGTARRPAGPGTAEGTLRG